MAEGFWNNWLSSGSQNVDTSSQTASPYVNPNQIGAFQGNTFVPGQGMATQSALSTGGPTTFGGKAGAWLGNGNNLGTVVQGLGSLTQAYLGFKQLSMAKDQLKFSKESWGKNFANSQKTYNTSLEDRINGRTSAYAGKDSDVQSYLAKHKLGG